jgi:tRNA threonylcarbamoyladenosine biosynthesis protein TsaE
VTAGGPPGQAGGAQPAGLPEGLPEGLPAGLPVEVRVPVAADMRELGRQLARLLRAGDLVLLTGELGAGKTTFAQGLGAGLGVRGAVTSPTFVIARVHPSEVGGPALVHVDAYRLGSLDEVDDLDLDASLADAVTVVEWGSGKVEGLSEDRLEVLIERAAGEPGPGTGGRDGAPPGPGRSGPSGEERLVRFAGVGPRWESVLA